MYELCSRFVRSYFYAFVVYLVLDLWLSFLLLLLLLGVVSKQLLFLCMWSFLKHGFAGRLWSTMSP